MVYDQVLEQVYDYVSYTGEDCVQQMLKYLKELEPKLIREIDDIKPVCWWGALA